MKPSLLRIDFHTHTNFSKDSLTSPEKLVRASRRKQIDRLVVADHNTIAGALHTQALAPERIIVGEVRGPEAFDLLQAMNTGHEGSMTTLHANSPRDALARLETMIMMAGFELPLKAMRSQIASAIDLVIQVSRLLGGARKVTAITET
ncbi:MAG: Flp pilus assembly complex ATPase component TadA, partial [Chloroflexi bacterium]|nr:Flp pilus assembly complex ATPase component TadA [Chloroflexota bacterium]